MLRKDIEKIKRKYRFDRIDIGSKCEPHTRKWILLLIFIIEIAIIIALLDKIDTFFARYDWAETSAFVIFSLPIAFYLWMWRNHDKNLEIQQKEIELEEAKRNSELSFFNMCMEKIIDTQLPTAIRKSYLTSFEPYMRGVNGLEYELQALSFIDEILKTNDSQHASIRNQFANSFNWWIQNGMLLFSEFHDMMLHHFAFSGISIKTTLFVKCDMQSCYLNGNFDKAMFIACDLTGSVFKKCELSQTRVMSCKLSACVFFECNIPFSFLQTSDISEIVLINSTIDIPEDCATREEKIYIVYTENFKEKVLSMVSEFPNAICKQVKALPLYYKNLTGPQDIVKSRFSPEAEWGN